MRVGLGVIIVALLVAASTALVGWWAVPVVGALWGFRKAQWPAVEAGAGAVLGWALLLALAAWLGDAGRVGTKIGGLFGVSGPGLVVLTLVLPLLLAASAAGLVAAIKGGPSRPGAAE